MAFINETGLGRNLSNMALRVAANMETHRIMVTDIGASETQALVTKQVQASLNSYQEDWNRNLAISYLEHFTVSELNSIRSDMADSPFFDKFRTKQAEVGSSMQARSTDLLQKFVSEVMRNAFAESAASKN